MPRLPVLPLDLAGQVTVNGTPGGVDKSVQPGFVRVSFPLPLPWHMYQQGSLLSPCDFRVDDALDSSREDCHRCACLEVGGTLCTSTTMAEMQPATTVIRVVYFPASGIESIQHLTCGKRWVGIDGEFPASL